LQKQRSFRKDKRRNLLGAGYGPDKVVFQKQSIKSSGGNNNSISLHANFSNTGNARKKSAALAVTFTLNYLNNIDTLFFFSMGQETQQFPTIGLLN